MLGAAPRERQEGATPGSLQKAVICRLAARGSSAGPGAALYCEKLICETDATRRWSSFASSVLAVIRSSSGDCHHNVARAGLRSRLSLTSVSSCCLVTARHGETELCRELDTGGCRHRAAQASAAKSQSAVSCKVGLLQSTGRQQQ